jgi:hypothetical protein
LLAGGRTDADNAVVASMIGKSHCHRRLALYQPALTLLVIPGRHTGRPAFASAGLARHDAKVTPQLNTSGH